MLEWKKKFIKFSLKKKALQFGNFKLKSGRNSPYFFNSRYFYTGADILKLGKFYVKMILQQKKNINILFGLAYKGIPIVVIISTILKIKYNLNIPYFFNRKEEKKYGEKGIIIGENIKKKNVTIIDDVITSGITIKKSIQLINKKNNKNTISNIFAIFNREEYGTSKKNNAIKEIEKEYKCKTFSIINIRNIIDYLSKKNKYKKELKKINEYYSIYGIRK